MKAQTATRVYDAVIFGAGASGLMCAMTAAARGRRVLLIDHAPKAGIKFSITGGGKCNLTNRHVSEKDYLSENIAFCRSALTRFQPQELLRMVEGANISIEEREHGQLFCRRSAKDLVRFFIDTCTKNGCLFALEEKLLDVQHSPATDDGGSPRFSIHTSRQTYLSRAFVIASGSPAWPQAGSTGRGYEIARSFGHRLVPIRPALVGLALPENWPLSGLSGISIPADIKVIAGSDPDGSCLSPVNATSKKKQRCPGTLLAASGLDLLFTHSGLSGPAALQASLYWDTGKSLLLNLLPGTSSDAVLAAPGAGKQLCRSLFRKLLPDRLCERLIPPETGMKKAAELSREERDLLAERLHKLHIVPEKTEGYSRAEVTAGGVSTEDISSRSMESKRVPGLFFCGEVMDVTGRLGGYNLHWAFASGRAAGESL